MGLWIGLDIGGTKCAVVAAKDNMVEKPIILQKIRFETKACTTWNEVLSKFCTAIDEISCTQNLSVTGIGISCGGPLDSKNGIILSPPNLPGWDKVPIVSYFKERYHVPVFLQNDANACAVAEWKFGAGQGCRNMIFLTFGTGLGAGLILNGQLYSGTNDMAGEVGHIRLTDEGPVGYGKVGSFEGFCSGGGIRNLAEIMWNDYAQQGKPTTLQKSDLTAKTVAEHAEQGDALAKEIYALCGKKLGLGLSFLMDILNPERIVIGSIYTRSGHLLIEAMQEVIEREALPLSASVCKIMPAELGDAIGDYAALGVLASEWEK